MSVAVHIYIYIWIQSTCRSYYVWHARTVLWRCATVISISYADREVGKINIWSTHIEVQLRFIRNTQWDAYVCRYGNFFFRKVRTIWVQYIQSKEIIFCNKDVGDILTYVSLSEAHHRSWITIYWMVLFCLSAQYIKDIRC